MSSAGGELPGVIVIIPAYNEGPRIGPVIEAVRTLAPEAKVVVVDDGSADDTCAQAEKAGAILVRHPFNLGYGAALQTGYRFALQRGFEALVQMDGDGQHDAACIADLVRPIMAGEADITIGSRFLGADGGRREGYKAPLARKAGMALFGAIASFVIGQKVTDPTSGYQAMNARVVAALAGDSFPIDYPDADVIIMLHRAGFRIREVPVVMYLRPEAQSMHSGLKPLYYVFKMFLSILVTLMRK